MAQQQMFSAMNNSPVTILTEALNSSGTTMTVDNPNVFPAAPNLAVLGSSDNAEIVKYTNISGNVLSIVRGQHGTTPGVWPVGTAVARNFTALDHDLFKANIEDLASTKVNRSGDTITGILKISRDPDPTIQWFESADSNGRIYFRENNFCLYEYPSDQQQYGEGYSLPKANTGLTRTMWYDILTTKKFDAAPTAGSANPVKSGGVKEYVDSRGALLYFSNQTVSVGNNSQILRIPSTGTNDLITTDTIASDIYFNNPEYISGKTNWTSYNGYIIFTGKCIAATTANVLLIKKIN